MTPKARTTAREMYAQQAEVQVKLKKQKGFAGLNTTVRDMMRETCIMKQQKRRCMVRAMYIIGSQAVAGLTLGGRVAA